MKKSSDCLTIKAVSDKLFSMAIFCIIWSGSQLSSTHTAAGFPENRSVEKVST
jgi:hypothetical protein